MNTERINEIAQTLHNARLNGESLTQFSSHIDDFARDDAYSIQEAGIRLREASGEKVIGLKMGLTSEGKRKQMNLDAPLYGVLTDSMQVLDNGIYHLTGSIHPKIEPEIVFYIAKDIKGSVTREEVLASCSGVGSALEILDSRYTGFKYFSMEDVISDNSSSSYYILGPKCESFEDIDLINLEMNMKINGVTAESGLSSAISGDPVISVMQLSDLLAKRDQFIPAGCFVLAGAATAAVNLEVGMHISLDVKSLASTNIKVEK